MKKAKTNYKTYKTNYFWEMDMQFWTAIVAAIAVAMITLTLFITAK